jgi:glyoxylase-like metal-dependent hydrolase (beta-lactamase superfamily II)
MKPVFTEIKLIIFFGVYNKIVIPLRKNIQMKKNILLIIIMALALNRVNAQEQEQETVISFHAGDYTVSILSEGGGQSNAGLLKGATPEQLAKYLPDGTFPLQTQVFLVRTPGHNILIDAGYGRKLFDNLKTLALDENSIDVILLTHMHGDHIGGLLRDGKAAFPKAEIYLSKTERDYWNNLGDRGASARTIFEVYQQRLHLFEPAEIGGGDLPEIIKGIRAIAAPGHTPGHTAFLVQSSGVKWLIWGDITHAMPIQMPCPEVALSFDVDPDKAVETRKKILEYTLKNNITAGGMHVPFPAVGKLTAGKDEGYDFSPICICEGI